MGRGVSVPYAVTADTNHPDVQYLGGWSFRESAGTPAAATVRLRNGAVGGAILAVIELEADGDETTELTRPIPARSGTFVEVVAGTVEGVLYSV